VQHGAGARPHREQRVKARHAVRLGRRHGEAKRDVVQRAGRDPTGPTLHGVKRRQQEMAAVAAGVASASDPERRPVVPPAALPPALRRAEQLVDGLPFVGRGDGVRQMKVQPASMPPITPLPGKRAPPPAPAACRSARLWP
jgi:hypothetical protein